MLDRLDLAEVGLNTRFSLSHADTKTTTLATLSRRLIELRKFCLSWAEDSRMSVVMLTLDTGGVKRHASRFIPSSLRTQRNARSDAVTPGTVGDVVSNA